MTDTPTLEPDELRVLGALANKAHAPKKPASLADCAKATKLPVAVLEGLLERLTVRGLVLVEWPTTTRGKPKYATTEAAKLVLDARAPKPAPKPKRSTAPRVDLAAVIARIEAMEARILQALAARAAGPQAPRGELAEVILGALATLKVERFSSGIVPLSDLRHRVGETDGSTRGDLDERLIALEREFRIQLLVANDPARVDVKEGIDVPGRGLLFYAAPA